MHWILFLFLSLIFLITPYQRGLFFDSDMYLVEFIVFILFTIWILWLLFSKSDSLRTPNWLIFVLPFMYLLTFFVAETPQGNFDNLLRWLTYSSLFIMLIWLRNKQPFNYYLHHTFQLTGIWIAFFALFGLWGWVEFRDIMLGDRMTGTFQYANTFAAAIGAFWLYTLIVLTNSKLVLWQVILYSLPLIAYGVGFFHSYSRGGLIVFPVAWLIGLLLLKFRDQISYVLYSIISFTGSLIVFRVITMNRSEEIPAAGSLLFFIVTLLEVAFIYLITRYQWLEKLINFLPKKKYLNLVLPILVFVSGILLWLDIQNHGMVYKALPESFQQRLSDISMETVSAAGRFNMYEDAFNISKDSFLLGLGGEGWRILFTKYQSLPYWSNEVHNGYLEVFLNTGLLGLIAFVFVFGFLFLQLFWRIRSERETEEHLWTIAIIPALLMLFFHAAIDFDFSYGTIWFMIMWLFAMGLSFRPNFSEFKLPSNSKLVNWWPGFQKIIIGLLVISVFTASIYAFRFHLADAEAAKIKGQVSIDTAEEIFQKTTAYHPYKTDYWINMARVYALIYEQSNQNEYKNRFVDALRTAEQLEQNNAKVFFNIGNLYESINEKEKAIDYYNQAIELDRFNVNFYEKNIDIKTELSQSLIQQNDQQRGLEFSRQAISDYEKYNEWYLKYKDQPIPDRRDMKIDRQTVFDVAKNYFTLKQFDKELEVLKEHLNVKANQKWLYDKNGDIKPFQVFTVGGLLSNSDDIIIISVKEEGSRGLSEGSKQILKSFGSKIDNLGLRGSYVSVIADNVVVYENINNSGPIEATNQNNKKLKSLFQEQSFEVYSAGLNHGNRSSIKINGKEYSKNARGMNIVILDKHTFNVKQTLNVDTYITDVFIQPF